MAADCKGEQVWFTRLHETDKGAFLREADDTLCYAEKWHGHADRPARGRQAARPAQCRKPASRPWPPSGALSRSRSWRASPPPLPAVEHRIEPVRLLDGVQYYNDSIATSPTRTIAGLRSFGQKLVLIAGGLRQKDQLRAACAGAHRPRQGPGADGRDRPPSSSARSAPAPALPKAACRSFMPKPCSRLWELGPRRRQARRYRQPVPGLASFDCYPNFEVRGQEYKRIVNALPETAPAGVSGGICALTGRSAARRSPPPSAASRFLVR